MKTQELKELQDLVGRIVLFKARNLKAAEWEMGMLESVEKIDRQHRVTIILKGRSRFSFDAKDYIVQSRA